MEFLLILAVAGIIFWALTSAAKVRASGDSHGCCGGGCRGDAGSSCSSDGSGSGD